MSRLTALLLAACACACTASASVPAAPLVRMDIVDRDTGSWLPEAHGQGQAWIAGQPGHRYGVRLANTTGARVLVVLSVDGVNAVTGDTAHPSQAGYVLEAWQSTEITGWRKSDEDVAQFVFTDVGDSYAARTGRPGNVGTVGIAVFREARAAPPGRPVGIAGGSSARATTQEAIADDAGMPAPTSRAPASDRALGTGHGAREWSPVASTRFERAGQRPDQLTQLRYDRHERLVARGVLPSGQPALHEHAPAAFPGHFVADPPGR